MIFWNCCSCRSVCGQFAPKFIKIIYLSYSTKLKTHNQHAGHSEQHNTFKYTSHGQLLSVFRRCSGFRFSSIPMSSVNSGECALCCLITLQPFIKLSALWRDKTLFPFHLHQNHSFWSKHANVFILKLLVQMQLGEHSKS